MDEFPVTSLASSGSAVPVISFVSLGNAVGISDRVAGLSWADLGSIEEHEGKTWCLGKSAFAKRCIQHETRATLGIIGRGDETSALANLIERTPWVTICGESGVGKSAFVRRLFCGVASQRRFTDVVVLDCQKMQLTSAVSLLDGLRYAFSNGNIGSEAIADFLNAASDRSLLLVLDGLDVAFESDEVGKPSAPKALREILDEIAQCLHPQQRLLVTCHVPVGSEREQVFNLGPLPASDALQLFLSASQDCGTLLRERLSSIPAALPSAMIETLDRKPLSVILAARWLQEVIQDSDCQDSDCNALLQLLRGRERHSLHSSDWIRHLYATLPTDDPARMLFRAMTLFPGGVTPAALHTLFGPETEQALARLLQLNLVTKEGSDEQNQAKADRAKADRDNPSNYLMLAPVRQVGEDLLRQDSQADALAGKILAHYITVAETNSAELYTSGSRKAADVLMRELPNIHTSMDRAFQAGHYPQVAHLAFVMHKFYIWRNIEEGIERLDLGRQAALKAVEAVVSCPKERAAHMSAMADCLWAKGFLMRRRRLFVEAFAYYHQAETIYEQAGSALGRADCWKHMGDVKRRMDHYQEALSLYSQAETHFVQENDQERLADLYRGIGDVHRKTDNPDGAWELFDRARAIHEDSGNLMGVASCLRCQAEALRQQAQYDAALEAYETALKLFTRIDACMGMARCVRGMGDLLWLQDRYCEAQASYETARKLYHDAGDRLGMTRATYGMGQLLRRAGKWDDALDYFQAAEVEYINLGSRSGTAQSIRGKGDAYRGKRLFDFAVAAYRQARKIALEIGSRQIEAEALRGIADVYRQQEQHEDALYWYEEAGQIYKEIGAKLGFYHILWGIASIQVACGELEKGITGLEEAKNFFLQCHSLKAAAGTAVCLVTALEASGRKQEAKIAQEEASRLRDSLNHQREMEMDDEDN